MYVKVRVTPSGKKERVAQKGKTEFEMIVKEPAQQNLANRRVQQLLAEAFNTSPRSVHLISGHRSGTKLFNVELQG